MTECRLSAKKLIDTIGLLELRIHERFPDSSIGDLCGDLRSIAKKANETVLDIQKSRTGYRLLVACFVILLICLSYWGFTKLRAAEGEPTVFEMIQVLDAAFNVIVLSGAALLFLVSIENRSKRRKAIEAVNKLRCIAHVVDALQLTKDPCYAEGTAVMTTHSPKRDMTGFQLGRYLDYCCEMLSLVSKIAFLYVQDYHDPVATQAVKDLEDLTNGLSRKIWQKIMSIRQETQREAKAEPAT